MAGLNYKHLRYFWMVAKTGSIARASDHLHLTPQSISGQLAEFESVLGVALFRRVGRGLQLTETGQRLLGYAEQIFTLGNELLASLQQEDAQQSTPFRVGIADSLPKLVAYRLLAPVLALHEPVKLICREGLLTTLLGDLAIQRLEMVIADRPMPDHLNVRAFAHFLGESGISFFAAKSLLTRQHTHATPPFPALLHGAPLLLPGAEVALQARLLHWLQSERLHPRIVGEFDDSALLYAFGQAGAGFFAAPTTIEEAIVRQYHVTPIGRVDTVREQIYAISPERRLTHPITTAISRMAQHDVFNLLQRQRKPPPKRQKNSK